MRLRYKISLILVVVSLAVCFMTYQSYALWVKDMAATQANVIDVGCFHIEYKEQEGSQINLQNTYPVSDEKGLQGTPYTFTITNTCTIDDSYIITLNTLNSASILEGNVVVGQNKDGSEITEHYPAYNMKDKIKFAISSANILETEDSNKPSSGMNLGEYAKIDNNINHDTTELSSITDLETSIIIGKGTLKGKQEGQEQGEIKTYHVYLWFDGETAGNEIMNQKFEASINVIHRTAGPKKAEIAGISIPVVTTGIGLYEVEHPFNETEDMDPNWQQTEYRYAGKNPNNYIWFNCQDAQTTGEDTCEKWRIIGLVNVKTTNGIKQRLKIIRESSIGTKKWNETQNNDWTKSSLMTALNSNYYHGVTSDFNGEGLKSFAEFTRDMTDQEIIWSIGNSGSRTIGTSGEMYKEERITTPFRNQPAEWSNGNVGLIYPSDYGYATDGGTVGRDGCLQSAISYQGWTGTLKQCGDNNWLTPSNNLWTISPSSNVFVYMVYSSEYVGDQLTTQDYEVFPVVYLSDKVKISDGTGEFGTPYKLSVS